MKLRIHGDNIIECERTLLLIAGAYQAEPKHCSEYLFFPKYNINTKNENIEVELLAGHDRWGVSISKELEKYGTPLREAADSYVTILQNNDKEKILFAVEFCNALPAGNNAWQRNGRAITCAEIGIPYLYFAEVGGVELDANRNVKAPRFPNPIVPFSYLTSSRTLNTICLPIYQAHPAITGELNKKFSPVFGHDSSLELIRFLIEKDEHNDSIENLENKGLSLVRILSDDRRTLDTFRGNEWNVFLKLKTSLDKVNFIKSLKDRQIWKKKTADKVEMTDSFKKLLNKTVALNCLSIGAKDIPICLVANGNIKAFANLLKINYKKESVQKMANVIENKNAPLLIVWVTGFKPRGDDSRPDRGLVPLARMLFGNDIDILTIVYGPAKKESWEKFNKDYKSLAGENGLWQAIINLSNYILVDSKTSKKGAIGQIVDRDIQKKHDQVLIEAAKNEVVFSEHDVDTSIHQLFTKNKPENIFESMCNPPGGDWSGISFYDYSEQIEYRWTSLPRVSANKAKRPDHLVQLNLKSELVFLSIESKNTGSNLEDNIGNRLKNYVTVLFKNKPTAYKKDKTWTLYEGKKFPVRKFTIYSGGAFCYKSNEEISEILKTRKLDFILSFQFKNMPEKTVLHIYCRKQCEFISGIISSLGDNFDRGVEIKIH